MGDYILLYDADCSMCTKFRNIIDVLDVHGNVGFMSIDEAEQSRLLDALPDALRHRSFHLLLPDMNVESGAEALPTLIGLLPSGRVVSKLIVSAPLGQRMLSFLYSMMARRHEAGLCKLPASRVDITIDHEGLGEGRSLTV